MKTGKYLLRVLAVAATMASAGAYADDSSGAAVPAAGANPPAAATGALREWRGQRADLWKADNAANQADRKGVRDRNKADRQAFQSGAVAERQLFASGAQAQRDAFRTQTQAERDALMSLTGSVRQDAIAKIKADRQALQEKIKTDREALKAKIAAQKEAAKAAAKARQDALKTAVAQRAQVRVEKDIANAGNLPTAKQQLRAYDALLKTVNARLKTNVAAKNDAGVSVFTQLQSELTAKIAALPATTATGSTVPAGQ